MGPRIMRVCLRAPIPVGVHGGHRYVSGPARVKRRTLFSAMPGDSFEEFILETQRDILAAAERLEREYGQVRDSESTARRKNQLPPLYTSVSQIHTLVYFLTSSLGTYLPPRPVGALHHGPQRRLWHHRGPRGRRRLGKRRLQYHRRSGYPLPGTGPKHGCARSRSR
jgi:hypothetical protein